MLRLVFLLIDAKVSIMSSDQIFLDWLSYNNLDAFMILTKTDKASQSQLAITKKNIEKLNKKYIKTSSATGKGIDKLALLIEQACDIDFNVEKFSWTI